MFCKRSWTNCMKCARLFIVSAFMLCSSSLSALAGEYDAALSTINSQLDSLNESVNVIQTRWFPQVFLEDMPSSVESHNWQKYLAAQSYILGGVDGLSSSERTKANSALLSIGRSQQWITTNSLPYFMREILKTLKRTDESLASNPWWATNSAFAPNFNAYSYVYPDDGANIGTVYSFPQFLSVWSSRLQTPGTLPPTDLTLDAVQQYWGLSGQEAFGAITRSDRNRRHFTWFDLIAEFFKTNRVFSESMQYSSSTNALLAELESQGFDTSDNSDSLTNAPLPEYFDPFYEVRSVGTSIAAKGQPGRTLINNRIQTLAAMVDGVSDSEIVVIPEFTVGGIHVAEYRSTLDSPITTACHSVMFFLFYVALFAGLFDLAQTEYAFYANLGRNWHMSKGMPVQDS